MKKKQTKKAFTLAEVLITLAVIGIVAAITIPTLSKIVNDKVQETRYKKTHAIITNGVKMMFAKEQVDEVDGLFFIHNCTLTDTSCMNQNFGQAFKMIMSAKGADVTDLNIDYLNNAGKKIPFKWNTVPYVFRTTDGTPYGVLNDEDAKTFSMVVDTNGQTRPNTVKKDLYKFRITSKGIVTDVSGELAEGGCSVDHPEKCKTQEECYGLGTYFEPYGDEGSDYAALYCINGGKVGSSTNTDAYFDGTAGQYADWWSNECHIMESAYCK